jgi:ribosomal protein L11 methyltransferase
MFQLHIEQCPSNLIEQLSGALDETGALSVILSDQFDDPILEPAPGEAPLWPNVIVTALYSDENEAVLAKTMLSATWPQFSYLVTELPEQDWERACLDQFQPKQFGQRLWICPSWQTPPVPDAVNLILDPGLAFGTGSHATTSLCLTWLEQAALNQKEVIDYGCGSGILAIAALKLGAAHAYAVDIDEQALIATRNNASNNAIAEEALRIDQPDVLKKPVDIIVANILLAPLLALRQRFRALLREKGTIVVSGILAEQVPGLIEAWQPDFLHVATRLENEWALIEFQAL